MLMLIRDMAVETERHDPGVARIHACASVRPYADVRRLASNVRIASGAAESAHPLLVPLGAKRTAIINAHRFAGASFGNKGHLAPVTWIHVRPMRIA